MTDLDIAFDTDAAPDARIRTIADQLSGMLAAGELEHPSQDTLRLMGMLPVLLLDITGDVFAMKTIHPLIVASSLKKQNDAASLLVMAVEAILEYTKDNKVTPSVISLVEGRLAEFRAAFWPEG